MRNLLLPEIDKFRVRTRAVLDLYGSYGDHESGRFQFLNNQTNEKIVAIASVGEGWEHVSVSLARRCPTWEEMCLAKDLFWEETDTVVQFHPKKSKYVNHHPYCLHMWKKMGSEYELPDTSLVGPTK